MTTKIKWTLLAIVLLQLTTAKSQNSRSYDTSEWIPITKSPNDDAAPQKKPSGRVLNLAENTNQKNFFPEEKRTRNKPVVEQYLRETTQVAPQKDYVRQPVRFQENARPKVQEQPKYYLIPKQREHLYLQQQEQQLQRQQLLSPQYNTEPYLQQQSLKNPYDPNSYFVPPTPPLNISLSPYQPLRPDTINQELIAALSKPASVQVISTTPKPKEEKETVQLLYVPIESLAKKEQPKVDNQRNWNEETRREPQYLPQQQHRLQGIQTDFAKQALEAHRLQMQLQAGSVPVIYTTTPKPTKKRKPHQPPLALYMGANHDVEVSDVLEELKHADTIAVQDNVGPDTPKVFVGPSNLDVPNRFSKFELPYLSSIDHNRIERKIEHLPFFVAPLSYRAPSGYSKIPLPSPHVGSVVVSTKATHEVSSRKPQAAQEEEDDSSEERPLYKFVPKYKPTSEKSEVDDEINRRLEQTESLFENQASKRQPVSLTVRSRTTTALNPNNDSEQSRSTTQAPRHIDTRPTKVYSFEEPQNVRITTEHVRSSRPRTYTYSFEEPQEVHSTSERPSRPRTHQQEEQEERVTSVRPSRPVTYSFEEPQEVSITTPRPSSLRTYSFEEPQPVGESTESGRRPPPRSKQYSTEEEPERKPQNYRQNHREEDDEEVTRRAPQRTSYPTTERVRFVEAEPTEKEESEVTYRKPPRENQSAEESDEEPPRRKPSRTRDRVPIDDAPPRRQSAEEETVRSSTRPRYEESATRPVEHSSEERDEDDSEVRERPTKVTYEDTSYQSTPQRQTSYEEPKQPYQTSNRFASTTPVYVARTTEDSSNERTAYYSPTPTNYEQPYRTEEEYNVRSSTPRYILQKVEEPQIYSVTTGRPEQVSPSSQEQSYEAKFAPYLNLDVHVKAPGLHESSIYDLTDKKANGPNPYEQETSKSHHGNRDGYNLPSHLPPINPEIPGLINNLQDQSIRQLLVPGLLVPTTEHLPVYKRPETTTQEYVAVTQLSYTTTTPEPVIETTTQKRTRSRQRGGSRFSLLNNRDSGEVTAPPRRTPQRSRRPQTRQRAEQRREEHEHTTEYTPVRATHDYTTTEASRRDITHSPRQRVRSRRPIHRENHEESRRVEETPRTTQPTPPPAPQSYIQFDRDQSTENNLQRSGLDHPVTELRDYHQVYTLPLQDTSAATSKEVSRPEVDVHVTHPEEHTTQQQYHSTRTQASSIEETETPRQYEEVTTTVRPRSRQRTRGRARVASSTTTATRKPTTTTTTVKPEVKEEEGEFYGFIRPPSYNKPSPSKPTETPAYTDFDKRFKIPSYTFDFPSYHYPHSHEDYYKELEAAGREPIQLYTNDKHLSTTPLYVYKPKFVPHTEEQAKEVATDDPLRHIKEEAREETKLHVRAPPRRKQEREGIRRAGSRNNEVSTEPQRDSKASRTRGRTHFQLPASLRTASEEAEVQGGNYPAEFLQKQASVTQPSVFQITVEPQAQDAEYDQQPFSSIQRPSIALPDEPNAIAKDEKRKPEELPTTVEPTAEETATTLPPTETTTEAEKQKGRRRGVWKLVKQRPVDNFETAESQNYRSALQLTAQDDTTKKDKSSLLDTLYEMFSSPQKDEASIEATTASAQTQVGNNTSSEELTTTTAVPETEATTILAEEASTISETAATEAANAEETTTEKVLKPYEVAPWEMKAVKTSTTTEVSHETEICFRGRCVKSSGIAETP